MSLLPGTRIGKYIIQRKLTEAGMAEIFLASSFGPAAFEKRVVLKRIRPQFACDATFVDMFISEAKLASRLNHANIVQIFDFDQHDDTLYIAMEYVDGTSLAQAHKRAREVGVKLEPALAGQIVLEVARGLSFAHRRTERGQALGLVHRDVTPQNILLSYEGAVKLTDFGIAKSALRISTAGLLKGKYAYMSPEQARGEPVDARTDIFALGVVFWELLTGQRLFERETDIAILCAVQEQEITSPRQSNPTVDAGLEAIVMRCLERDRAARFQTTSALERDLNRHLATTERPEETEIAAWMYRLYPAGSAESESASAPRLGERLYESTDLVSGPTAIATPDPSVSGTAAPIAPPLVRPFSRATVDSPDADWLGEPPRPPSAKPLRLTTRQIIGRAATMAVLACALAAALLWPAHWSQPVTLENHALGSADTPEQQSSEGEVAHELHSGAVLDVPPGAPTLGPAFAKVTIVEWSDFQCPYCSRAAATLEKLRELYGKDVRLVFRNLPLPMHSNARMAAQAAMAAHAQGSFWPMHDKLFANQAALDRASLERTAEELGLDMMRFKVDYDSAAVTAMIEADEAAATAAHIRATPSLLVNGRLFEGVPPLDQFREEIAREVARADKLLAEGVKPKDLHARLVADAPPPGASRQ